MKKQLTLTTLALCSGLMTGPAVAYQGYDIDFNWDLARCYWPGGCRYTYQLPNPPAGKQWNLQLLTGQQLNDDKAWMNFAGKRVAAERMPRGQDNYFIGWQGGHIYRGSMPTGGEIEFWLPFNKVNGPMLRGKLVDR